MDLKKYYSLIAEELTANLTANLRIKEFTSNPELLGQLAEESVSELVSKFVSPLRVSTGSVISAALHSSGASLPQIDTIIWNPTPFPALFSQGNFGIVPSQSCVGIMEIKRSNYSGIGAKIKEIIDRADEFVDGAPPKLHGQVLCPDKDQKALGLVCIYDTSRSDGPLKALIESGSACYLLEHDGDLDLKCNRKGVLTLVDFLNKVRRRAVLSDGWKGINVEYIESNDN